MSFPGGKAAEVWRWTLTPYSAEVKEIVELHHHSPLCGSNGMYVGSLYIYLYTRCAHVFQKYRSHLRNQETKKVTWSKFHTEVSRILGATLQI